MEFVYHIIDKLSECQIRYLPNESGQCISQAHHNPATINLGTSDQFIVWYLMTEMHRLCLKKVIHSLRLPVFSPRFNTFQLIIHPIHYLPEAP